MAGQFSPSMPIERHLSAPDFMGAQILSRRKEKCIESEHFQFNR